MTRRSSVRVRVAAVLAAVALSPGASTRQAPAAGEPQPRQATPAPATPAGQSTTRLPDGRWLLLGGETDKGTVGEAAIVDAQTGKTLPVGASLAQPRAWHTAPAKR